MNLTEMDAEYQSNHGNHGIIGQLFTSNTEPLMKMAAPF